MTYKDKVDVEMALACLAFFPAIIIWLILLPFPKLRKPIEQFLDMWRWD